MTRICVDCGAVLGNQRCYHEIQKPGRTYPSRCYGPRRTDGYVPPTTVPISRGLPIHMVWPGKWDATLCGLTPGRIAGKYKNDAAQVSWARTKADVSLVTCEDCLVVLIQSLKQRLHERLKGRAGSIRKLIRQVHGRRTMVALWRVVGG